MYGFRREPGWPPAASERRPELEPPRYRTDDDRTYERSAPPSYGEPRRYPDPRIYASPEARDPYSPRPATLDRGPPLPPEPRRLDPEPRFDAERRAPAQPPALYDPSEDMEQPRGQKVMSGGARPPIQPIQPERIAFTSRYAPGTIIIETAARHLLLVVSRNEALRYPISVGRIGFQWTGTEKIRRIADWPDWHPPASMRQREPYLPLKMTGGIRNPLGAKALYLGNSLYRIHGTNDARTIGLASSSGCFRMLNGHVVDLAARVRVGTTVVVLDRLPRSIGRGG